MKAVRLISDSLIKKYYNLPNWNLYFREGEGDEYEIVDGFGLDEIIDASTFGFYFIAIPLQIEVVNINDLEFVEE